MTDTHRVAQALRAWREAEGLTFLEASKAFNVSLSYYMQLERGDYHAGKKLGKIISDRTGIPLLTVLGLSE